MAAFAAAVLMGAVATARVQPPVEAFGSLPFISQPQLSPDGAHFVALQSLDGKPAAVIYLVNAPAGAAPQVFGSQDWPIVSVFWAKNDRVVIYTRQNKSGPFPVPDMYAWYRSLSLAVGDKPDWVQLFNNFNQESINTSTADIVDRSLADPDAIFIPQWSNNDPGGLGQGSMVTEARLDLYRVDVHTGKAALAALGPRFGSQWIMDGHGNVVGRVDRTIAPLIDHVMLLRNGDWTDVMDFDASADRGANVFGLTFDGKSLAFLAPNADGRRAMYRLDLDSGRRGAVLFSDPRYDVWTALRDEWTGRVIGISYAADKMEYVYFDPARAALQRGIEAVFPGKDAHAVSVTQDGRKAIVAVEAPDEPLTFYFLDRDTHVATKIASEFPALSASDLGAQKPYPYKARDGLDIPAYLTLPAGGKAKNLPVVVIPHGGLYGRDRVSFDWLPQFLASRGYAVLQPNYRGSGGYGRAFTDAGLNEWGLKIQDDISDGVKALIADGIADPKRICIMGQNSGGFAALAGATFTPDLYACAVSIDGITDLRRMMTREKMVEGKHSSTVSFWTSRFGDDESRWDQVSPDQHADKVRVPVLLIHTRHDPSVPYSQGEAERDALEGAGKKVELVTLEGGGDVFAQADARIQILQKLDQFLRENIGQ